MILQTGGALGGQRVLDTEKESSGLGTCRRYGRIFSPRSWGDRIRGTGFGSPGALGGYTRAWKRVIETKKGATTQLPHSVN